MNRRIFKSIVCVALVALLCAVVLVAAVLYTSFTQQRFEELKTETRYIKSAVELYGTDFLEQVHDRSDTRVTHIAADGTVLYDSKEDASHLENHANREEFREALSTGEGTSRRRSDTLSEETLNYAVRLQDGTVLRVSGLQDSVWYLLASMSVPVLLIVVGAVLLSLLLASRLSKKIMQPINNIDLEHPNQKVVYEELRPLVARIEAQNDQIKRQMERLEQEHQSQDKMRREFTANVSHELKTPLTSISGFAEIIKNGLVKQENVRRFAGNIYDEAQRLIVLVGDIIKLSQLDENEIAASKEPIDLYDAASAVLDHLKSAAQKAEVSLQLKGEHTLILGVEQIVDEIIYNLCDNAIKYNRPGGRVTVSVCACESGAKISVSDTGIGIAQEEVGRIFERFYRVNKSHSKEVGGTGLGLSIVKHGAAYHRASIEVKSELRQGTTISVTFPE